MRITRSLWRNLGAVLVMASLGLYSARADEPNKLDVGTPDKEHKESHGEAEHKEHGEEHEHEHEELSDLFLSNLFSEGWHEKWEERHSEGAAVRIPLYRTRQPFLLREVRLDYAYADRFLREEGAANQHSAFAEIQAPLNRRVGVFLETSYDWIEPREPGIERRQGPIWAAGGILQLVDTCDSALNAQVRVEVPEKSDLGEGRTVLQFALAGFRDLGNRVGLQASIEDRFLLGARNIEGQPDNALAYSVALTKTLTEECSILGNFTVFTEAYGVTELNGDNSGRTNFGVLPGVRWEPARTWWVGAGIEIPISGPRESHGRYLFTLIKEF